MPTNKLSECKCLKDFKCLCSKKYGCNHCRPEERERIITTIKSFYGEVAKATALPSGDIETTTTYSFPSPEKLLKFILSELAIKDLQAQEKVEEAVRLERERCRELATNRNLLWIRMGISPLRF